MLILSLCWLLLGVLIGALANGAKLRPPSWQLFPTSGVYGWLWMLAISAVAALLGGWLGALLLGKYIATATALWVAVLGVVAADGGKLTSLRAWAHTRFGSIW